MLKDSFGNHEIIGHATKSDYVYFKMKEAILSGEIEHNTKLIIRSLAQELKVSEIPVREALRRLEAEKLVNIVPHTGAVVNPVSVKDVEEGLMIREILEPWAGKLATANFTQEHGEALRELVQKMTDCINREDFKMYGHYNKEFHLGIYRISKNDTLVKMISELWDKSERLRVVFKKNPARMKASNEEHMVLIEALENGDENEVSRIIQVQRLLSSHQQLSHLKTIK